jgi:hypothetical protein
LGHLGPFLIHLRSWFLLTILFDLRSLRENRAQQNHKNSSGKKNTKLFDKRTFCERKVRSGFLNCWFLRFPKILENNIKETLDFGGKIYFSSLWRVGEVFLVDFDWLKFL